MDRISSLHGFSAISTINIICGYVPLSYFLSNCVNLVSSLSGVSEKQQQSVQHVPTLFTAAGLLFSAPLNCLAWQSLSTSVTARAGPWLFHQHFWVKIEDVLALKSQENWGICGVFESLMYLITFSLNVYYCYSVSLLHLSSLISKALFSIGTVLIGSVWYV